MLLYGWPMYYLYASLLAWLGIALNPKFVTNVCQAEFTSFWKFFIFCNVITNQVFISAFKMVWYIINYIYIKYNCILYIYVIHWHIKYISYCIYHLLIAIYIENLNKKYFLLHSITFPIFSFLARYNQNIMFLGIWEEYYVPLRDIYATFAQYQGWINRKKFQIK